MAAFSGAMDTNIEGTERVKSTSPWSSISSDMEEGFLDISRVDEFFNLRVRYQHLLNCKESESWKLQYSGTIGLIFDVNKMPEQCLAQLPQRKSKSVTGQNVQPEHFLPPRHYTFLPFPCTCFLGIHVMQCA